MSSPSSLEREAECLASVVLPHTRMNSPRAWRGKEIHRFLAIAAEKGRDVAILSVEEQFREAARAIDFSKFPKMNQSTGRPEVGIALNPDTGATMTGPGTERDDETAIAARAAGGYSFLGYIDWLGLTDDAVVVIDWKTGYTSVARAEVNRQLSAYAVMATAAFGRPNAVVGIGRVLDNGEPWFDVVRLDELEVEAAAARLRAHLRRVDAAVVAFRESGVVPRAVEGEHCRWCPAYAHCPAKKELLASALPAFPCRECGGHGQVEVAGTGAGDRDAVDCPACAGAGRQNRLQLEAEPLTPERAAELWPKLLEAERLIARLKNNVKGLARQQRVQLANGNVLGLVTGTERSLVADLTADYIAGHMSTPDGEPIPVESVVKVERSATLGALEAAVKRTLAKGEKFAPKLRLVEADMEATGALRRFAYEKVDEVAADSKRLVPEKPQPTMEEQLQQSLQPGDAA